MFEFVYMVGEPLEVFKILKSILASRAQAVLLTGTALGGNLLSSSGGNGE